MPFQFVIAAAVSLILTHNHSYLQCCRNKVQQADAVIEIDLIRIGFQLQGVLKDGVGRIGQQGQRDQENRRVGTSFFHRHSGMVIKVVLGKRWEFGA